jgi:hypothetical protein
LKDDIEEIKEETEEENSPTPKNPDMKKDPVRFSINKLFEDGTPS